MYADVRLRISMTHNNDAGYDFNVHTLTAILSGDRLHGLVTPMTHPLRFW